MSALDSLHNSLAAVNARSVIGQLGEPKAMGRTAEHLERKFGNGRPPDNEIVLKTLRRFIESGSLSAYRDIKNVCYGVLVPYQGSRTLVSNKNSFSSLLGIVDGYHGDPKKLKRCFQALMAAYLSLDGCDSRSHMHEQWDSLRRRLERWLPQLAKIQPRPDWLVAAFDHCNLFRKDPTSRYGVAVLRGDRSEFEGACEKLGIGRLSWVRRRVVISAVEAAVAENDGAFQTYHNQNWEPLSH